MHYYAIHNLFPKGETVKSQKLLKEALIESGAKTQSKVKPMQKAIKTAIKHIYSKVNDHFEKIFKVSFAEAQTKVKELQLQKKLLNFTICKSLFFFSKTKDPFQEPVLSMQLDKQSCGQERPGHFSANFESAQDL